jgi:hypothetical protein
MQPTATSHRELPLPVRIFHAAMEQQLSLADYAKRLGISSESLRAIVTAQPIQDETDILDQLADTYHQPREALLDQLSNRQPIAAHESFADWLKRNMEGISQHALRTRAQVDAKTFKHFLHAEQLPDSDQAERISRALYIDRAELARIVTANMAQFAAVASRTPEPARTRRPRRDKVNSAPQIGAPQAMLLLESELEEAVGEPTQQTAPHRQRSQKAEAIEQIAAPDVYAGQEPAALPPVEATPARRRTKAAKRTADEQLTVPEASALPVMEPEIQSLQEHAALPPLEAEAQPSQEPVAFPESEPVPARRRAKAARRAANEQLAVPEAGAPPVMEPEVQPSLDIRALPVEAEAQPSLGIAAPGPEATQGKTRKKRQAKAAQSTGETDVVETRPAPDHAEVPVEPAQSTLPAPVAAVQAETMLIESTRRTRSAQPELLDTPIEQPAVPALPAAQPKGAAPRKPRAATSPAPSQEMEAATVAAVHTAETTTLQLTADEVRLLRHWRQLHPHGRRATLHYIGSLLVDE